MIQETSEQRAMRRLHERMATGISRDQQEAIDRHRAQQQADLGAQINAHMNHLAEQREKQAQWMAEQELRARAINAALTTDQGTIVKVPKAEAPKPQLNGDVIILCPKGDKQKVRLFRDQEDKFIEGTFKEIYDRVQLGSEFAGLKERYDALAKQNREFEKALAHNRDTIECWEKSHAQAVLQRDKAERELQRLRGKR